MSQTKADRGDSALGEADAAITLNKLTLEEARGWVKEARDGTNVDDLEATTLADATEDLTEDEAIAVALPAILHTAVEDGDDDTIIALLDGRADPNVQNVATNGTTPLYVAAQNGHLAAVVALLDKNADPNLACTEDGSTPLLMAADGEVGTGSDDGGSSFSKAGWGQGIARNALPDPGLISGWGNKAASDRNFGVAKLTPMFTEVVAALLAKSADPNMATTDDGSTPLLMASQAGNVEVVTALLNAKANPNLACTDDSQTPLYVAAETGQQDIVVLLLEHGALQVARTDGEGPATPLLAALANGHKACGDALRVAKGKEKK